MPKQKTSYFSKKLKPLYVGGSTKTARKATRKTRTIAKQTAWKEMVNWGLRNGTTLIGRLPSFIPSPILCPKIGPFPDQGWEQKDGFPELYLEGTVRKDERLKDVIIWQGVSLNSQPPKKFYQQRKEYVLLPPEGLLITYTEKYRYLPVLTASEIETLALINQRIVAIPGQDRVFGLAYSKLNKNGDSYKDNIFYFVTPNLFTNH
mgnify:CR=1 FL=1